MAQKIKCPTLNIVQAVGLGLTPELLKIFKAHLTFCVDLFYRCEKASMASSILSTFTFSLGLLFGLFNVLKSYCHML